MTKSNGCGIRRMYMINCLEMITANQLLPNSGIIFQENNSPGWNLKLFVRTTFVEGISTDLFIVKS